MSSEQDHNRNAPNWDAQNRAAQMRVAELRRVRRAFVCQAHPDRGGDPAVFRAGLRRLDRQLAEAVSAGTAAALPGRDRVRVVAPATGLLGRLRAALAKRAARTARRARLR